MLNEQGISIGTDSSIKMNMKKRSPVFPKRLYDMLEKAEEGGYDHIISWLPDGAGFKIHNDGTQCKEDENQIVQVLKKAFNQSRYKSFLRQLQLYGFERQCKGKHCGECKHVLFRRGQRELLHKKSIEDFQIASVDHKTTATMMITALPTIPSLPKHVRQVTSLSFDEEKQFSSQSSATTSSCSLTKQQRTSRGVASRKDSMSWIPNCLALDGFDDDDDDDYSNMEESTIPTKLKNLVLPDCCESKSNQNTMKCHVKSPSVVACHDCDCENSSNDTFAKPCECWIKFEPY